MVTEYVVPMVFPEYVSEEEGLGTEELQETQLTKRIERKHEKFRTRFLNNGCRILVLR